ncbi:MAG: HAD family hydrolase, partial [Leptospira sp.]|nr:HAD family hydrolase [Leptospira sp.]
MRFDLKKYETVFWDFDGVIKESGDVKTNGYLELFREFGTDIQEKVRHHHLEHGGVSRFEKIPYYFREYIGRNLNGDEIVSYCSRYSEIILQAVIDAPYVPGVLEYIDNQFAE